MWCSLIYLFLINTL